MKPDPKRQRIALFGNFGTGNLGNEATLQAMLYNLRRYLPNAELSCICMRPENTASEHNISAVPIRARIPIWKKSSESSNEAEPAVEPNRWPKALAKLRRACGHING